ncbi:MAG: 3-phosphoshikimate 1-carboxyvinyltransferase [Burkholderiales bacterium]
MIVSRDDHSIVLNAPFGAGGKLSVPGSKSISNRALLLAALSIGQTELKGLLHSDDTNVMIDALRALGVDIDIAGDITRVSGCSGAFPRIKADIFLGNAGTAVRTLVPVLALGSGEYTIRGVPRMHERPIGDLVEALLGIGAVIHYEDRKTFLPLRIKKSEKLDFSQPIVVNGNISSQFLTGLLLALPLAGQRVTVKINGVLVSKPYVQLTLNLMDSFGIKVTNDNWEQFEIEGGQDYSGPKRYEVEGDASSASYFFAAGMLGGGPVLVKNVIRDSIQGDIQLLDVLSGIGATVGWTDQGLSVAMDNNSPIQAFDLDLNHIPDAAMTLAIIALFADGPCRLRNIGNWRVKETDRLFAMTTEMRKLGVNVIESPDGLEIEPPKYFNEGVAIDTYDDHRMAMCFSLISFAGVNITINDPKCVHKTFPDFFAKMESVLQAPVVTIDGPSGSGKGTVARQVAERLEFSYLDSGALYRAVGLFYLNAGGSINLTDPRSVEALMQKIRIDVSGEKVLMNGEDVTQRIREEEVSMAASKVAKNEVIRGCMYDIQRSVRHAPGLVADGRDMGTTVFPNAQLKIYLTASLEERARRRYAQLVESGERVKMKSVAAEMAKRDSEDASRSSSPMRQAESAIEIDSTGKSIDEVVQIVCNAFTVLTSR